MVRKEPHACAYAWSRTKNAPPAAVRSVSVESMQQRIDRLETLVTTLASQDQSCTRKADLGEKRNGVQNGTKPDNNHTLNEIKHGLGVMEVTEHHSKYRGSTHWGDVLGEVCFSHF